MSTLLVYIHIQGEKGETGAQGEKGEKGDQGEKGDKGADGVSVIGVTINEDNKLVITLSEGDPIIIDKSVVGADGKNGNGISKVTLTEDFYLVFDYTDGTSSDKIGPIKGKDGVNGIDGLTPILTLDDEGDLSVKYGENGTVTLLGNIKGIKGDKGDKGVDGKSAYELYIAAHPEYTGTQEEWLAALKGEKGDTGRGIAKTEIIDGELIITYTDGTFDNLGKINDKDDTEYLKFTLLDDGTLSVAAKDDYKIFNDIIGELSIPAEFRGKAVTQIADSGFSGCESLKKITLPNTITVIGNSAFYGCSSLEDINFSDAIATIGSYAFFGCYSLTEIELPDNITELAKGVFAQCKKLKNVTLPANLEKICGACFEGCKELKEITIPAKVNYIEGGRYTETGASFLIYSGIEKVNFEDSNKWYRQETANASLAFGVSNVFSDPVKACELLITNIGNTTNPKYYYFYKKI